MTAGGVTSAVEAVSHVRSGDTVMVGGFGRFGGRAAQDEFTELRWITVQSGTRPFPF